MNLSFQIVNNYAEAVRLRSAGWCPIEASYGTGKSVVDGLCMDHHGDLSDQEPVSVRAYRDHYGALASDPRFFTAGPVDADATFAAAALAALIPGGDADFMSLAKTIGLVDSSPVGVCIPDLPFGDRLLLWNELSEIDRGAKSCEELVLLWKVVMSPAACLAAGSASARWHDRASVAISQMDNGLVDSTRFGAAIDETTVWGFDHWYGRILVHPQHSIEGWENPFVMARSEHGEVTIGCPNESVAAKLFGPGGLKSVFPKLEPEGWGGREAIGGSPRGRFVTESEFVAAFRAVNSCVIAEVES